MASRYCVQVLGFSTALMAIPSSPCNSCENSHLSGCLRHCPPHSSTMAGDALRHLSTLRFISSSSMNSSAPKAFHAPTNPPYPLLWTSRCPESVLMVNRWRGPAFIMSNTSAVRVGDDLFRSEPPLQSFGDRVCIREVVGIAAVELRNRESFPLEGNP